MERDLVTPKGNLAAMFVLTNRIYVRKMGGSKFIFHETTEENTRVTYYMLIFETVSQATL